MKNKKSIGFLTVVISFFLIAFSNSPPDAKTGAPFNGRCTDCHGGTTNITGNVQIEGLPSSIMPNTDYTITVRLSRTGGNPPRGGFELVAVQGNNTQAGSWSNGPGASFSNSGGRVYWKHNPSKNFSGNDISWSATWTSPTSSSGNQVTMYTAGLFGNNMNGSDGDFMDLAFESGTMPPPNPVSVTISNIVNVKCFGDANGSMKANVTGGVPPYTYLWSNGSSSQTNINLAAGNYTVTATDFVGSTGTAVAAIATPTDLVIPPATIKNVSCPNGANGSITINPTGGTVPYKYFWSNGAITKNITNLTSSTYDVTVMDNNSCTETGSYTVSEPDTFNVIIITQINPTCPTDTNGLLTIHVEGGTGPFTYKWSSSETTLTIKNKKAGTYSLSITDANACTISKAFVLSAKDTIPPKLVAKSTQLFLDGTGKATLQKNNLVDSLSDNCDPNVSLHVSLDSFNCSHIGKFNVIITATDANNNSSKDTVEIAISDTLKPFIIGWQDTSFTRCDIKAPLLTAGDNCKVEEFKQTQGIVAGDYFLDGINIQEFELKDANGNSTTSVLKTTIHNPVSLTLDTSYFTLCTGDSVYVGITLRHALNYGITLTHHIPEDSSRYTKDTSLYLLFKKPEPVLITLQDSLLCRSQIDSIFTYPKPLLELVNVSLVHPTGMKTKDGEIIISVIGMPDSLVFIDALNLERINNTGKELSAGYYTVIAYKGTCAYELGTHELKFISKINTAANQSIQFFPNPFHDRIDFTSDIQGIKWLSILDNQGKVVSNLTIYTKNYSLPLTGLNSGIYHVIIQSEKQVYRKMIVKM